MRTEPSIRLHELLKILDMNATDFAKSLDIPKASMSMYLNGSRQMKQDRLYEVAEKYNINPAWLMGYDAPLRMVSGYMSEEFERQLIASFYSAEPYIQDSILGLLQLPPLDRKSE